MSEKQDTLSDVLNSLQDKLKKPCVVEATYRITTPMFVGDANQAATEISASSVKGALRFWWRAMNWGAVYAEHPNDEAAALRLLHQQEAGLFGSSADESRRCGGQGAFALQVTPSQLSSSKKKDTVHPDFEQHVAARYLAYGVMEAYKSTPKGTKAAQLTRDCLNEQQLFKLKLIFRNEVEPSILDALICWGLLGGLGSRSRQGLGSVSLEKIEKLTAAQERKIMWSAPSDEQCYIKTVQALLMGKDNASSPVPYTAFGEKSRVEILTKGNTPYSVLDAFAKAQLLYRSWGRYNKVLGLPSEKNFECDHNWYRDNTKVLPEFHPKRVVFGLPHNYDKNKRFHVSPESDSNSDPNKEGRRASPLLFHVHKISNTSFLGVAIYLPATFLSKGRKIKAGNKLVAANIDWTVITEFMDGSDQNNVKRFPNKCVLLKGSQA